MFWKLFKMELKSSWRSFSIMYLILFIAAICMQLVQGESGNVTTIPFAFILVSMLYSGSVIALFILFFVTMINKFEESMFGKQAYLTQTLPVTTTQLLLSKLVVAIIWIVISIIMILLSLLVSFCVYTMVNGTINIVEILNKMRLEFSHIPTLISVLKTCIHIFILLTETILSLFFVISFVYSCYVKNHRVLIAVLLFFAMNIALSMIVTFMIPSSIVHSLGSIINVVVAIAYFFLARYFIEQKMELE